MRADLSSGDLARATGNTVRTIRFYEEEGLLRPAVVSEGGHRRYTEEDLERLRLIIDLRELGLSLGEIRSVLEIRSGCHTAAEFALRFQQVLSGHLEQAQKRLERLRRVRKELVDAVASLGQCLCGHGDEMCACAVADDERAPRIVRLLARRAGCCGKREAADAGGDVAPVAAADPAAVPDPGADVGAARRPRTPPA